MNDEFSYNSDMASVKKHASSSAAYVSNVLKTQFGNSEEFLAFERSFYYTIEELNTLRNTCEQLRTSCSKLQEEKRAVELELVSEKVVRDQEARNASMEIEKNKVQQNAELYAVKCEAESWKRKAEATAMEINCLKEQMKSVEHEKNQAVQKFTELKSSLGEYDRHRQSLETYARWSKELNMSSIKKLEELEQARATLALVVEHNEKQLNSITTKVQNWAEDRTKSCEKIAELERDLITAKAEQAQAVARMERMEKTESHTTELIGKLMEQNKDLQNGMSILIKSVGDQASEADRELVEKANDLHQQISSSLKRLKFDCKVSVSPQIKA